MKELSPDRRFSSLPLAPQLIVPIRIAPSFIRTDADTAIPSLLRLNIRPHPLNSSRISGIEDLFQSR